MKTVLVIGASGGIGRVVARQFLEHGHKVIGTNFKNDFQDFLIANENFQAENLDLTKPKSVETLAARVDNLAAIVNCAGVVDFEAYNEPKKNMKIWESTIGVNLTGSYRIFEQMKDKFTNGGVYVMISSTDSYFGGKVNTAYAVSKAGLNSLVKSLALMFQDSKIRVNAIAPGWVETAMMEKSGDALIEYAKDINPLKRLGSPEDVASLAEFLASAESSYINGEVITLDGGYTAQDPTLIFEEQQLSNKAKGDK